MSELLDKIQYTQKWVNDIYNALREKGIDCFDQPLEKIGNSIRKLNIKNNEFIVFGMQNGLRSQSIDILTFKGTTDKTLFTSLPIEIDSNKYIYNYYRTNSINYFSNNYKYTFQVLTNEREEF